MLVKQISNLFALMDFFVRAKRPLSVGEIVAEFSWPRSSVFNTISTLVEHGYLYQPVPRGGYYPTSKWMDLARELSESQPLPESVHELLVELMRQTGETMILAAPEGTSVVFLDVVESPADIRLHRQRRPAATHPRHCGGPGDPVAVLTARTRSDAQANQISALRESRVHDTRVRGAGHSQRARRRLVRESCALPNGRRRDAVPFPFRNRRNAIVLGAPVSRIEQRVDSDREILRQSVSRFLKENEG